MTHLYWPPTARCSPDVRIQFQSTLSRDSVVTATTYERTIPCRYWQWPSTGRQLIGRSSSICTRHGRLPLTGLYIIRQPLLIECSTNTGGNWHVIFGLTLSSPVGLNVYTSKCLLPYWSNPPFLIFLTFGHSGAQDWAPECPNVKNYKDQ